MYKALADKGDAIRQARLRGLALLAFAVVLGIVVALWLVAWSTGWPGARVVLWSVTPSTPFDVLFSHKENAALPHPRTGLIATSENRGQVLFGRYCDSCHPAGHEAIGANLRSAQFKAEYKTQAEIVQFVRKGGFDMPAYKPDLLSDADLDQIAQYVLGLPEDKP